MANGRVTNFAVGSRSWKLADVFKEDFADIEDPKASVKSVQETLIQILNVLRGMEGSNNESE